MLIKELSLRLTNDFGKGFTQQNLRNMRLDSHKARLWYIEESAKSNWSVRALERQIGTFYYERIISSKKKQLLINEANEKTKDLQLTPKDIIKDSRTLPCSPNRA